MSRVSRAREKGRGERVLPGLWRLRLPLPWPGIPHGNAWALAAGGGLVLVDTGYHEPGSLEQLERALGGCGLALGQVGLVVCTHAHADHYGQAAAIVERAGCELWMHPDHAHGTRPAADPEQAMARRIEVGLQSGVPEEPLLRWARARAKLGSGLAGIVLPDRELVDGVRVDTDLGPLHVIETPGHAPSHVCLHQPEHRLLISGDHLLGRVSLYFDHGWTPDPAAEFLRSLDAVERLDARLCLSGHGRPFTDLAGHIAANRALVHARLAAVRAALDRGPATAYELVPAVHGRPPAQETAGWWLPEVLCYLTHLEARGHARRVGGEPERWAPAA